MKILCKLLICMVVLFSSCGGGERHIAMLDEIDSLCDSDPRAAISRLDSIDCGSLSEKERHYYDLLSIKSRDKAYVRHTSDSLILDVIDYYSSHKNDAHYPEALYYGGRVYSDIGDLPTALKYFQDAIDAVPDKKGNMRFKSILFNQTGRLLHSLRLDSAAISYLEKSLDIEKQFNNNYYGVAFTHKLIGNSYLNIGDQKKALSHISEAYRLSKHINDSERFSIALDYADILSLEEKFDSALQMIRDLPPITDSVSMSHYLASASQIYLNSHIPDTSYMYARYLTLLKGQENKKIGYKVIFSNELSDYVPKDTLIALISEYKCCIEEFLNNHEGENAIIQNTRYNYDLHVKEREKTEIQLHIYMVITAITVILFLSLLSIILYNKFKGAQKNARYMTIVNVLKDETFAPKEDTDTTLSNVNDNETSYNSEKLSEIKNILLARISSSDEKKIENIINKEILSAKIYRDLNEKINTDSSITASEETYMWNSLEKLIESVSPGFGYRLLILTEGKITPNEKKLAMLMKCGFSPIQISILMGREKNTISTHRRNLAAKILGKKKADKDLDLIIISL